MRGAGVHGTLAARSHHRLPESAMPVVTPTRLPFVHTLLQRAAALRHDAALGAVTVAALCAAGLVVALGPLPVQALISCA
jgi:hypothetical protein